MSRMPHIVTASKNIFTHWSRDCYRRARRYYQRARGLTPALSVSRHDYDLLKLGSGYGGWTFIDSKDLSNAVVVSCGLGEDASFDIEFASQFNSKVVIVDPTPRAIVHFNEIIENLGNPATRAYTDSGKQPVEAYNLSMLSSRNLQLVDKALWNESKTLSFYSPRNPNHVSHSIVNFQNDYRKDTDRIEVEAVTIDILLKQAEIKDLPLMKLDIEGAEIEVILDMMEKKIFPNQILVEFDEMAVPSETSKKRIESAHAALLKNGYKLINLDFPSNFLYTRF